MYRLLLLLLLFFSVGCSMRARRGPDAPPHYLLPLASNTPSLLLQGYSGPYGHQGKIQYAYDFKMPIGTPIVAARKGVVLEVQSSHEDSTRTPGQENYIFIDHGDGTFGRYYHLTKNGVLVRRGQSVKEGDLIGKSGDSGASAGPHLHFDVTSGCSEWGCQTIPITIYGVDENPLIPGKTYRGSER